ncbi:hypothetical protein ACFSB1_08180 [Halopseudomonas phragmitis]|uniref:Flagellin n=1 Tax=Halopseudomonas phragmitis TaxID=1931241 RepID=A0A1V0B1H0_9GAMM|nr:hypothetical protein [Halopseudomonas phragmitis]AQZ93730.1 hypothetical protein BVH74_02680 [Halopseudomonas phragmitis]
MKIDKQLPVVTPVDPQGRRQTVVRERPLEPSRQPAVVAEQPAARARKNSRSSGYGLQLNRQLSAMQSADSYLADLTGRLDQLKLSLSRQLTSSKGEERQVLRQTIDNLNRLLEQRSERSAGSLDANLRLSLNEPARSRFSLPGLESLEALQVAGRETLIIKAGRQQSEPRVVALEEGLNAEQLLRRFNNALMPVGIRAELNAEGDLRFSSREADWKRLQGGIQVQGEGRLFEGGQFTQLHPREERLLNLDGNSRLDNFQSQRQMLDEVVQALDRIALLRDQLAQRQQEIREFLAQQSDQDEQEWAQEYARSVFGLMHKAASSYAAVTQAVVAQANLNRFAVVSLLS